MALKICNNNYTDRASAEHELRLMKHITAMNKSSPGRQFVRTLLDSFEIEGPHGTHICLVYEPLREPIWLLQRRLSKGGYPLDIFKTTVLCILSGLDYLHSECHVIHTGEPFWFWRRWYVDVYSKTSNLKTYWSELRMLQS